MDHYDQEIAARVWQRVRSGSVQETAPELLAAIGEELTETALYQKLSRHFNRQQNALLRQIAQDDRSHAACLTGIYTMLTGTRPKPMLPPIPRTTPDIHLRRCYGRKLQSAVRYEAKASDPEYGSVFSRLAAQERTHCRLILELLGQLNRKP